MEEDKIALSTTTTKKRKKSSSTFVPFKSRNIETDSIPWTKKRNLSLHDEIIAFVKYYQANEAEKNARMEVIERVRQVVTNLWPKSQVEVFGSFETGLLLPTSDIDMVILGAPGNPLNKLSKELRQCHYFTGIRVISHAKVPIIKLCDETTGYQIDLSFNIPNGIENTVIIKQFLKEYPSLKNLVIVIKAFLQQRALNETYSGGMGSYTLVLLLVNFLQFRDLHFESQQSHQDLGKLLKEFFEFFGTKFNYYVSGICVLDGGSYYRKRDEAWFDEGKPFSLSVRDPHDPSSDVGKNSWQIMAIRQSFQHAFKSLDNTEFGSTPLSRIIKIDPRIIQFRENIFKLSESE